jgi:sec-independent protein translocase protein TatA
MNIFGIGLPEMAVIAAIGLLVFGPKRLPELGRTLGRTLKGFQSASSNFEQEFRKAIDSEADTVVTANSVAIQEAPAPAVEVAAAAQPQASAAQAAAPAPATAVASPAPVAEPAAVVPVAQATAAAVPAPAAADTSAASEPPAAAA